jgi:Plasmid recombination enzyme
MKNSLFLKFRKIKSDGRVFAAGRHNKRELQHERGAESHIDARRSELNYCLAGEITARGVRDAAMRAIAATGRTMRKDGVRVVEVVFSLSRNSTIDHRSYFADCTQWVGERFGDANILSSDVHLDESAPHCHVLFLPLVGGRMRGSDLLGGRASLVEFADDFHEKVASLYGLSRRVPKLSGAQREMLAKSVLERLRSDCDPATRSRIWVTFIEAIESDPEPFAAHLEIDIPEPVTRSKRKSLAETMTGAGKRTSEDRNPLRFAAKPKTSNHLLCKVHVSESLVSSPVSPSDALPSEQVFVESTRVRDTETPTDRFNPETGEFVTPTIRPRLQKLAAAKWVNDRLPKREVAILKARTGEAN